MASDYPRAAGYFRVSTNKQADPEHWSLDLQRARFHAACQRERWVPAGEYQDVESGRHDNRRNYQRMLDSLRAGEVSLVVVQWLDRFGRNHREILRRIWEIEDLGGKVVATDEDIAHELIRMVRAWQADQESVRTSQRVTAVLVRICEEGRWPGRPPFGYRLVMDRSRPDHGKLIVDEERAALVRRIFALYDGSRGVAAIAQLLNREGVGSPNGGIWWSGQVKNILVTSAYAGQPVWRGVAVAGGCPPIVDPAEWERVQGLGRARTHSWTRHPPDTGFLVGGLVVCGCGARRHCWCDRSRNPNYAIMRHYRCGRQAASGTCGIGAVKAERLDAYVVAELRRLLPLVLEGEELRATVATHKPAAPDRRAGLRAQIARLDERRATAYDRLMDGTVDPTLYRERDAEYRRGLADARRELAQIEESAPTDRRWLAEVVTGLPALLAQIEPPPEQLRAILSLLVERIVVESMTTWRIEWHPDLPRVVPH